MASLSGDVDLELSGKFMNSNISLSFYRLNNIANASHFRRFESFFTLYQTNNSDAPPIMITHCRK